MQTSAMALLCSMALTAGGARDPHSRFLAAAAQVQAKMQEAQKNGGRAFARKTRVEQADLLVKAGVRTALFDLEALGRLYREHSDEDIRDFGKWVYKKSKDAEDALGKFDKYQSTGMKDEENKAASAAMEILSDDGWVDASQPGAIFGKLVKKADKLSWPSVKKDNRFLLQGLVDHLKHIQDQDYDMTKLEGGMHQLRRDLRWVPIFAKVFNGLLKKSNKACPQDETPFKRFADPKYSGLPPNPAVEDACEISACLWEEINGTVGVFGQIKDKAEKIDAQQPKYVEKDLVPAELVPEAQQWYEALKDSKLIKHTRKQIEACLE